MSANVTEIEADLEWRNRSLLIVLGIAGLFVVLMPTYTEIFDFWWNYSAYNHCILIVPISLFLAYEKRSELLRVEPAVSWLGGTYFFINSVLWIIGGFLSIAALQHLAAIGLIIALIWALIGNSAARVIAFPLLYLYFGVPEGEVLVPYLRDLTAEVVVNLLRVTGIPVFMEGRYLTIPSGQFHVAKACSGINYLIATLAVGTVFAYTRYKSNWRRLTFMILAIMVPLLANGIRAYGIVMIAHLSDYKYAMGIDHYIYGWLFFGIVIFILFAIGNLFSDTNGNQIEIHRFHWVEANRKSRPGAVTVLLTALILIWVTSLVYQRLVAIPISNHVYSIKAGENWGFKENAGLTLFGSYAGKPIELVNQFQHEAFENPVSLHVALYPNQEQNGELENRANLFFDEEKWHRISGPLLTSTGAMKFDTVEEFVLRRYGRDHLAWVWYEVSGDVLTKQSDVKWALTKARLAGDHSGGAHGVIVSPVLDNPGRTREVLKSFLTDVEPLMSNLRDVKNPQ